MTEYGTLKLKMGISYYDVEGIDVEKLEESITCNLSPLGSVDIGEIDEGDDIEIQATLEVDAVRTYFPATWDDNGGTPGDDELDVDITESRIETILAFNGHRAHVSFYDEAWEAA